MRERAILLMAWLALPMAAQCQVDSPAQQVLQIPDADEHPDVVHLPQRRPFFRFLPPRLSAGELEALFPGVPRDDVFRRGQWNVSFMTGWWGVNLGPADLPFSMLPQVFRLGWIVNQPRPDRRVKGCWEAVFEMDVLPVVNGPGSIALGLACLARYNFGVHKPRSIVPYFQMGGGGLYCDTYLYNSRLLSSGFEFVIHIGGGCRAFLNRRLAVNLEWNYAHLSNSGIVLPNVGVNQLGGTIGLTYFLGRR